MEELPEGTSFPFLLQRAALATCRLGMRKAGAYPGEGKTTDLRIPACPFQSRAPAPYCSLLGPQKGAPCTVPPARPGAGTRAPRDPHAVQQQPARH